MDELRERITRLQKEIEEKNRAERMLDDLDIQRQQLKQKITLLNSARIREQDDVDKLSHKGLTQFALNIAGKYEERLSKEKEEAYAVLMKYETAKRELEGVEADIARQKEIIERLSGCEEEYQKALREKERTVVSGDDSRSRRIYELHSELAIFESRRIEIEEAIDAGKTALIRAGMVLEQVESAEDWGLFDIIGGGLITTLVKHSKIDEAQKCMEELQVSLRRFRTELADVERIDSDIHVDFSDMLRFGDWFFDGLVFDIMVQNRLKDSHQKTIKIKSQVTEAIHKLELALDETDERMLDIKMEIEKLIVLS